MSIDADRVFALWGELPEATKILRTVYTSPIDPRQE